MSNTPRTDAAIKEGRDYWGEYVDPDFARQLERELNQARRIINDTALLCAIDSKEPSAGEPRSPAPRDAA